MKQQSLYYHQERPEILDLVPQGIHRALDVGCGGGRFGALVKRTRGAEVWGVEISADACRSAALCLDRVIEGPFTENLPIPRQFFDLVVFNDVLEHMIDPSLALRFAKSLLTETGIVVASIPNIRHFPTVWRLAVRGEWTYRDSGILDRTHLRFFTRRSILDFFAQNGYAVTNCVGLNAFSSPDPEDSPLWKYYRWLNRLCLGGLKEMHYLQFGLTAQPAKAC